MEILNVPFVAVSPGAGSNQEIDETPLPDEAPAALVQRLSKIKAETVVNNLASILHVDTPHRPDTQDVVVAADTVVALEDEILGKPATPAQAVQMLKLLRRQPHNVYSGLTVAYTPPTNGPAQGPPQPVFITRLHQSKVWMRPYTNVEIEAYVAGGSPLDKAGAYGIQDQDFAPVERLQGCFASVMGLPLGELAAALNQAGLSLPEVGRRCSQHTGSRCCQISIPDNS